MATREKIVFQIKKAEIPVDQGKTIRAHFLGQENGCKVTAYIPDNFEPVAKSCGRTPKNSKITNMLSRQAAVRFLARHKY